MATCGAISPTSMMSLKAIVRLIDHVPPRRIQLVGRCAGSGTSSAPWRIYNIGNNKPEELMHVVAVLEKEFGRTATKEMLPMQPGDVRTTFADIDDLDPRHRFSALDVHR